MIAELQKTIYEHILSTNSSIAIELIQHFFAGHFLKEKFSNFIFDYIRRSSCKRIFETMDPKDTAFLDLLFKCHNLDSGSHDDDRIDPSEFHKLLFKTGFHPKANLLPMIIYHFDKSGICEMYELDNCWNKSDIRDLILNFDIGSDASYQYCEVLTKQLTKWKDCAARDFYIPLSKKPPISFDANGCE